jgi:hypothetical protein
LQNSLQALAGKTVVNDVTLTGAAEWIAGSDDETGSSTYKATAVANRLDVALRVGTRSEIRLNAAGASSGNWVGLDGVSHPISDHNLMTDPGWFPAFTLGTLLSSSNTLLTYVGQETRNGALVLHVSGSQQFPNLTGSATSLMQHLTQVDIYLDASSFLPISYVFSSHPDNNAAFDIPTEIRYSNYQTVAGTQIPFHVQRFVNNTLALDLQIQTASLNTGVTIAQ